MQDTIPVEALLEGCADDMRRIAERLRAIVRATVPEAEERVRPGWRLIGYDIPVGRRRVFAIWVWAQPEHVHLGFQRGNLMADPDRRLEGRGITKLARWLTFAPGDEIHPAAVTPLILDCARIAGLSRAERAFLELDRDATPTG